jgi:hypothetical protein
MFPPIPPGLNPADLLHLTCSACNGIDPVELLVMEDAPRRFCGRIVTMDDRFEFGQVMLKHRGSTRSRRLLVKAMIEAGGKLSERP